MAACHDIVRGLYLVSILFVILFLDKSSNFILPVYVSFVLRREALSSTSNFYLNPTNSSEIIRISSETSQIMGFAGLSRSLIAIIGSALMGFLGQTYNRKIPILVSIGGLLTMSILNLILYYVFELKSYLPTIIIYVIMGITGGSSANIGSSITLIDRLIASHCRGRRLAIRKAFFNVCV